MILGIGVDLVDLNRFVHHLEDRFIKRILSDKEQVLYAGITDLSAKLSFIGGRFAAKEALFKAISKGDGSARYTQFSILNDANGKPYVETDYFKANEIIHLSITHTKDHAMAYAIMEDV